MNSGGNHGIFRLSNDFCPYFTTPFPFPPLPALDLLRNGRIRAEQVITHRFALRDAEQAFRLVEKPGDALKAVIVVE